MAIVSEQTRRYIDFIMAVKPDTTDHYDVTIADLEAKQAEIGEMIANLKRMRAMGGSLPTKTTEPIVGKSVENHDNESVAATVVNGLAGTPYYGLGLAEASIKCLSLTDRQVMTVKKIWKTLSDAGVKILADRPEAAVSWALRKRERKVGDVVLIGNGEWGLENWYEPDYVAQVRAKRNNASSRNREEHIERTKAGMELAWKQRGVRIGAKRKMTPEIRARAEELLSQGKTIREVADEIGMATSSITGNGLRARALRKRGAELRLVK
jgi:hypothetical protein